MVKSSLVSGYELGSAWPTLRTAFTRIGQRTVWVISIVLFLWGAGCAWLTQPAMAVADSLQPLAASGTTSIFQDNQNSVPAPSEGETRGLMPPDIERILNRGKLVVAVLGRDNAPFFMDMGDGEIGGLDIQLARAIASELGVELELKRSAKTFNEVVDKVYWHGADMAISKISRTMKRARRVRFSQSYLQMRQGLLINRLQLAQQTKSSQVVETIRNLTGKVGVIEGSSYVGFLQERFPKATIVEMPSWNEIVTAVIEGKILAGYRDELEIKKVVLTQPDAALQLQTAVLTDTRDALAIVMPWESTHLLALTNQYLETLATEYTVDGLLDKYSDYWLSQK